MEYIKHIFGGSNSKQKKVSNKNLNKNSNKTKSQMCSNTIERKISKKEKIINPKTNVESYKYTYKYIKNDKVIKDKNIINKLNNIRIPPNYQDVKICLNNTKILGYGYDEDNRKQVIYNPEFRNKQQIKKHKHLIDFGVALPNITKTMTKDLNGTNRKLQLISLILHLIQICDFRIGNETLTKKHEHYGVSTLNCKHIKFLPNNYIEISFIGKKGVENYCKFQHKNIYNILKDLLKKNCKKVNTKKSDNINNFNSIFIYIDENNNEKKVNASDVNDYLKQFGNFTSKNFRTWNANSYFIQNYLESISNEEQTIKKHLNSSIEKVSLKLHNTKSVCKKEYLNSNLINLIENNNDKFLKNVNPLKSGTFNYLHLLKNNIV